MRPQVSWRKKLLHWESVHSCKSFRLNSSLGKGQFYDVIACMSPASITDPALKIWRKWKKWRHFVCHQSSSSFFYCKHYIFTEVEHRTNSLGNSATFQIQKWMKTQADLRESRGIAFHSCNLSGPGWYSNSSEGKWLLARVHNQSTMETPGKYLI